MEEENFGTEEKLKALFSFWLVKTHQTATLCGHSFLIIQDFLHERQARENSLKFVFMEELLEILKHQRDYYKESIEKNELVPINLTFEKISEIPKRYVVAVRECAEITQYLSNISEKRLTQKRMTGAISPIPSFSWIMQTEKAVSLLYDEVYLRFDLIEFGEILDKMTEQNLKKQLGYLRQLKTRLTKKQKNQNAVHEALDELSKKHGESWRHFRLKKKFDLLWEHPIKRKKTLGKLLEQEGLKKGKDGRQRTVEDMIKNHDVKGEKSGN